MAKGVSEGRKKGALMEKRNEKAVAVYAHFDYNSLRKTK